jgi:hypothetical protein
MAGAHSLHPGRTPSPRARRKAGGIQLVRRGDTAKIPIPSPRLVEPAISQLRTGFRPIGKPSGPGGGYDRRAVTWGANLAPDGRIAGLDDCGPVVFEDTRRVEDTATDKLSSTG